MSSAFSQAMDVATDGVQGIIKRFQDVSLRDGPGLNAVTRRVSTLGNITPFANPNEIYPSRQYMSIRKQVQELGIWMKPTRSQLALFLISAGITAYAAYKIRKMARKYINLFVSYWIDRSKLYVIDDATILRNIFRSIPIPKVNIITSTVHSHPISAANRSTAMSLASAIGVLTARPIHSYQASNTDLKKDITATRTYYWDGDVQVPYKNDTINKRAIILMVDVDYYVDMPEFLLDNENPVFLYSFQPKKVAENDGEYTFLFTDNEVEYRVNGGASYKHKVWNYGKDFIGVTNLVRKKIYQVERRKADDHHDYIFLIPLAEWRLPFNYLANMLKSEPLTRLSVKDGEFNVMKIIKPDGIYFSIARLGATNETTVSGKVIDALSAVARNSSIKINMATIQSWVNNDRLCAAALIDYLKDKHDISNNCVYTPTNSIIKYELGNKNLPDFEAPPIMVPFMQPILAQTCYVPTRSANNDISSVVGRVIKPRTEAGKLEGDTVNPVVITYIHEFVKLTIDSFDSGIPYDVDEVYARQSRPAQRHILDQGDSQEPNDIVKTFLKAEPYQKPSDPRVISTFNPHDKREYSRFLYAFTDYISTKAWYGFGTTPKTIAESIARFASAANTCTCADANRHDGHVRLSLRMLEKALLTAFFQHTFHKQLHELLDRQIHRKGVTSYGYWYDTELVRCSGSPETACLNSCDTKFIDYVARRHSGVSMHEAYHAPGLFAGDDSISFDVDPKMIEKAGKLVGSNIEAIEFRRGAPGVNFLSRYFTSEVWTGNPSSMCDIPRILSKIHVTPNLGEFSKIEKLTQKLMGLYRTDAQTPLIKSIIETALDVGIKLDKEINMQICSWWAQFDKGENWPNELPLLIESEVSLVFSEFDKWDHHKLWDYLSNCTSPDDLLTMPHINEPCAPIIPAAPAVIGDDIVVMEDVKDDDESKMCWDYFKGKCRKIPCNKLHLQVCRDFVAGGCRRGQKCKFKHIRPDAADLLSRVLSVSDGTRSSSSDSQRISGDSRTISPTKPPIINRSSTNLLDSQQLATGNTTEPTGSGGNICSQDSSGIGSN